MYRRAKARRRPHEADTPSIVAMPPALQSRSSSINKAVSPIHLTRSLPAHVEDSADTRPYSTPDNPPNAASPRACPLTHPSGTVQTFALSITATVASCAHSDDIPRARFTMTRRHHRSASGRACGIESTDGCEWGSESDHHLTPKSASSRMSDHLHIWHSPLSALEALTPFPARIRHLPERIIRAVLGGGRCMIRLRRVWSMCRRGWRF